MDISLEVKNSLQSSEIAKSGLGMEPAMDDSETERLLPLNKEEKKVILGY